MITTKLAIAGMHCTSCAFNIDGELEDTPGVSEAKTNYAKQETIVSYDPAKVSLEAIQVVIGNLGYQAMPQD